jgi:hypothetical protein
VSGWSANRKLSESPTGEAIISSGEKSRLHSLIALLAEAAGPLASWALSNGKSF